MAGMGMAKGGMLMTMYPGLPLLWSGTALAAMALVTLLALRTGAGTLGGRWWVLSRLPAVGPLLRWLATRPAVLVGLRLVAVALFLLVIATGLFGNQIPQRNLATMLTWTFWWTGVIISVLVVGSAWCAICPWDALANLLVRQRIWGRAHMPLSLELRVPRWLRNTWPALAMFVGLTWLELGFGITTSPYGTAVLALIMVVLATLSMALFERKAFCHYFCAVGRTLGAYSTVAPVAVRPVDTDVCARCKTLECYHGTGEVEPCPTHLVMGRLRENTFCISCGACAIACPKQNVAWRARPLGSELALDVRPRWDHAWFILGLVALTSFHGFTMMPFWESWMSRLAQWLGDSGQLLWSFSIGMTGALLLPIGLFALAIWVTRRLLGNRLSFRRLFAIFALPTLPLAFSYHLAHNLTHLVRESAGFGSVLANPFGVGAKPLSMAERMADLWMPMDLLFTLQTALIVLGFWLAMRVLRQRASRLPPKGTAMTLVQRLPVTLYLLVMAGFNLWLLMQPMIMRM